VEIALVVLVVAAASTGLYAYLAATRTSLDTMSAERPLAHARLAADLSTLAAIRTQIDVYRSVHGQRPASRDASGRC